MELKNYESAMSQWQGRTDSETDYDSFRWHQWVQELDLNKDNEPFEGPQGFCIIGFCSEQGVQRNKGRVGAALAPDFIRRHMGNLPCTFQNSVKLFDAGNILCQEITMEEGQRQLGGAVKKILDLNLFPIVLGGGHETTFGHYQGQLGHELENNAKPDLGIVNFDAHFDLRPYDVKPSSGSMFRQIADICSEKGIKYGYLPMGIQKHSNTVSLFKTADALGVKYVLAKDIRNASLADILEKVDTFTYSHDKVYLTVCTDVFSSAFAPGVSAPQATGLDPELVLPIIKHIIRTHKVCGFDICEISPRFDQDDTTASLGAVIAFSVVNTICKLKNLAVITETDMFS